MKRILIFLAISWFATTSGPLFAALGDTEEDIAALFGKPVETGFPDSKGISTNRYQKGEYIILVQFLHHLSLAESYTRVDKEEFSPKEIIALLAGNSNGIEWDKDPENMEWRREDHKAHAWMEK